MMPEWKIQDNFVDIEKALNLKNSCDKLGIPASGISIMPFVETLKPLEKGNYIFSGSTKLVRLAHREAYGGIWFHPENFDFYVWEERLSDFMLNKQLFQDVTLGDLTQSTIQNVFIRPRYDLKPFASGYVESAKEWAFNQIELGVPSDEVAIVSIPKNVESEFRFLIIEGHVVTQSAYRVNGVRKDDANVPLSMLEYAAKVADIWTPEPVCILDTCIADGEMYLMEFNCFNASGFYAMDTDLIAKEVTNFYIS